MLFSSLTFLIGFLPVVLAGYYLLDKKWRNCFLLLANMVFYAWGEPKFVIVMAGFIVLNYVIAFLLFCFRSRAVLKKTVFIIGMISNMALLGYYKYTNFITLNLSRIIQGVSVTDIALPLGISFFTFQMLSYVIDVYREPEEYICKNILDLGLYISFFPQLIAGPIVRYSTIYKQINDRTTGLSQISDGAQRFILGLSKKVLIANNMAIIADKAFSMDVADLSTGFAWVGAIAYTFQIFFDFSGYSDMAIGLGKMFGFEFDENFNYPYMAKSVTDFWSRWHISLSTWFKDYVYIPLGGDGGNHNITKTTDGICDGINGGKNQFRLQLRNLFIVWLLTGIWHGASWHFIAWGIGYFIILAIEKFFRRSLILRDATQAKSA